MKWFDQWLYRKVRDMWEHSYKYDRHVNNIGTVSHVKSIDESSLSMDNSLRFNVLPAQGGTIIEVRHYDRKVDHNTTSTYVIPDDNDLTTGISHIVSMELLKKGC
jgi:hypothetical protein